MSFELMSTIEKSPLEAAEVTTSAIETMDFDPDERVECSKVNNERISVEHEYNPDDRVECSEVSNKCSSEEHEYNPDDRVKCTEVNSECSNEEQEHSSDDNKDRVSTENNNDIDNQNKEISSVETGKRDLNTTQEKGNYGEMKTDADLRQKGYERISKDVVTSLNDKGHQGIDGVYYNPNGKPKYMIVDAKYGSAQLSETADGKQMSEKWIDNRLDVSVGKEKADEIRLEKILQPDNVGSYISHIDEKGNVTYDRLNEEGNVSERNVEL